MSDIPTRSIVVALDFGTTFSGVAWAQTSNPSVHYIINQWPQDKAGSIGGMTSEKVPTEIAYEYTQSTPSSLWGFQIPEAMPRHQWIKLGLCLDQKVAASSRPSATYVDPRRASMPHHTTPEGLVTDYLRCLKEHITDHMKSKIGAAFEGMAFEYVITVPAMWPDKAKMATLECAESAGLGKSSRIRVISEPEAAACHSLRAANPHGLEVDDTIIICDAGGGTVDLITFSIVELEPSLCLKEQAAGEGGLCGSSYLNRRFEEFLEEKLSSSPGWGNDTLEEATNRFETVAKRTFKGNLNSDFMVPVPGIADNEAIGVKRGRLCITGQEMISLFQPIVEDIRILVKNQVSVSRKKVKSIFLVGGFGQSPYLRKYLLEAFSPEITVLAPVDGWTAVVRGALSKTMGEICPLATQSMVESRVARKHYGTLIQKKFTSGVHVIKKRYWDDFRGEYVIDVMRWFIQKRDDIKEDEPIKSSWYQRQLQRKGNFNSIRVSFYELDLPAGERVPLYFNRQMKQHAVLHPRLGRIEQGRIPVCYGCDGESYYKISYEIHASYFSAHCEYSL
ncbi:hypothetical protein FE257_011193 [Aspergillus nanangensis]|uniref:Actin-like ATPase domain-containing protein n=1 Tax=Aspergillus nanangensis TaxID=2582783 RepID=A0AAD4GQT3_ASPNN|nr:hypothetical protein FE257_011193 [Aspergillus nanangensis]